MAGYSRLFRQEATDAELRMSHRELPMPKISSAIRKERERLEKDTAVWLSFFFPGIYRDPFGDVHYEIIEAADYAIDSGGRAVVLAPRGTGKSYVIDGCAIKAVCQRRCRFPVVMPWDAKGLKKAISFWKKAFCFNAKLNKLYPEICYPFRASKGSAQRCAVYTHGGDPVGAQLLVSEGMIVLPDSIGVIGGATINGNPLGLHFTTNTGEGLRPDLVFIDDPQDRETATSDVQIRNTIELIDKDIAGMAGPDKAMPILMAATMKQPHDVAKHYATIGGDWRAVVVGQIVTWPKDMEAWKRWNDIRLDGEHKKDNGKAGIAYYIANKEKLTEGFTVSWASRFKKGKNEPDALYSAMVDYFQMGHNAFMAERQNDPVESSNSQYKITAAHVAAHYGAIPPLTLPDATAFFVGHIDINKSAGGLHFCVAGFDQTMTGHCPAYGHYPDRGDLWPTNAPEQMMQQAIYAGLKIQCDRIAATVFMLRGKPTQPSAILVDASFQSATVHRFAQWANPGGPYKRGVYPFAILPAIGRAAHNYRFRADTVHGKPYEECHIQRSQTDRDKLYAMFNADYWRETMQRAFLAPIGAAGGMTLFRPDRENYHVPFAEQIVAESISNKYDTPMGQRWEWTHRPGARWDWSDAMVGCWVGAALCGLSVGGMAMVKGTNQQQRARGVRHVTI